ncbi:MAG: SDR family oxidoreductase [Myxococcales bacterium]|nr:SDR family oxidoreductase [Myxococcales bacterium]MCB9575457.1 SDR family oxidoreductase [Polyangiaceae bacterium]
MERRRALIAGATGYLGGEVVKVLHEAGYWVRALARDEARLAVRDACDDVFVGEATKPSTLSGAMDGIDVVFSSIGLRSFSRKPTIWDVDCQANLNLVELAERAGVRDFAFASLFRGDELRSQLAVAEARERVVDALRASKMRATVVRPNGFFNDMREMFDMAKRGRVWLVGSGAGRFNPIHGADIAEVVVDELTRSSDADVARPIGGPDVFSMRGVGELAFEKLGKPPRFGSLPAWVLKAGAAMAKPFNQNAATFLSMFAVLSGDAIAPQVGKRHLADFFSGLCQDSDSTSSRPLT